MLSIHKNKANAFILSAPMMPEALPGDVASVSIQGGSCFISALSILPTRLWPDSFMHVRVLMNKERRAFNPLVICLKIINTLKASILTEINRLGETNTTLREMLIAPTEERFSRMVKQKCMTTARDNLEAFVEIGADKAPEYYMGRYFTYFEAFHSKETGARTLLEWYQLLSDDFNAILEKEMDILYKNLLTEAGITLDFEASLTLEEATKMRLSSISFQILLAKNYGLCQNLSWQPTHAIDGLMASLKLYGYLFCGAQLGVAFYNTEAKLTRFDEDVAAYAWSASAYQPKNVVHALIVVGAFKKTAGPSQGSVFYVDPAATAPGEECKVYSCSYERFCDRMRTLSQGIVLDASLETARDDYLYYHPALAAEVQALLIPRVAATSIAAAPTTTAAPAATSFPQVSVPLCSLIFAAAAAVAAIVIPSLLLRK